MGNVQRQEEEEAGDAQDTEESELEWSLAPPAGCE